MEESLAYYYNTQLWRQPQYISDFVICIGERHRYSSIRNYYIELIGTMQKPNRFAELYSLNQMPNTSSLAACFNLLLALLFHLHELSFFYFFLRTLHP